MNYTPNFSMKLPGYGDNADIADLNENTTTIDGLVHDNRTMIAQAYSQLESYVVGDIVENEGKLYRCIGATSGNWDSTKWTRTTLGDEVEEGGASALADLDDVSLTTPTEGQILTYDGDEWVNADAPDVDVTKTASGNPIEVSDSANAPLVKCVSAITGSQDLHGYDKPWVGGAGKNKLPLVLADIKSANTSGTWSGNAYTLNGVTFTVNTDVDGNITSISTSGTASAESILNLTSESYHTLDYYGIPTSGDFKLSGCPSGGATSRYIVQMRSGNSANVQDTGNGITFTANSTSTYYFRIVIANGQASVGLVFYPMLCVSTESATFAPYSNICPIVAYTEGKIEVSDGDGNVTTHTTTYPSAIYRGSEDVVKGTVGAGNDGEEWLVVDLGDLTWTYSSSTQQFRSSRITGIKEPASTTDVPDAICEIYETKQYTGINSYDFAFTVIFESSTDHGKIYIKDSRYTDATDFANAVSGYKLAYRLATPTTSSVTPTNLPIKSLSPYSHIESSTGEMEIEYIAKAFSPITEIVDSQISALQKMMELMITSAREATMTASANYTTGTLIVACGALYKATTAISSGASLVVGTNITPTTIAAEIAALA